MKKRPYLVLALSTILLMLSKSVTYAQDIPPASDGDLYSLQVANVYFEVDAGYGAQISSFQLNDQEILFPIVPPGMGGSTFWHSPQNDWGWPPATVLDSKPYTGGIEENYIILQSGTENNFKVSFTKTFYGNSSDTSITIIYNINNMGTSATTLAPWEVTRVPAEGITFWPMGEGSVTGDLAEYTEIIGDLAWYGFEASDIGSRKFFSDGDEGWFAHVDEDSVLFIKQFANVPYGSEAPTEGEIELWLTGDHSYIELENQGEYAEIPVEYQSEYLVKWYLRKLPKNISIAVGNQELVDYVNRVIGDPITQNPVKPIAPDAINAPVIADLMVINGWVIVSDLPAGQFSLEIFDLTGKLVQSRQFQAEYEYNFSVNNIKSGVYIYRLYGGDNQWNGKLVIP